MKVMKMSKMVKTRRETDGVEAKTDCGICGDDRFWVIEDAKARLLESTNVGGSPDEMKVLDSLLFRMWQMGWLPGCRRDGRGGGIHVPCGTVGTKTAEGLVRGIRQTSIDCRNSLPDHGKPFSDEKREKCLKGLVRINVDCQTLLQDVLTGEPERATWRNGSEFEYEYAYCSNCGRMQWAGWDCHEDARRMVGSFHGEYGYCPGCGARMEGGEYVEKGEEKRGG